GRVPDQPPVVASVALPQFANLQEELALVRELERHVAVSGHPHVVLVIDEETVLCGGPAGPETRLGGRFHPLITLAGPSPGLQEFPGGVELEETRDRGPLRFCLPRFGSRHLKDPHVIAWIRRN